MAGTPQQEIGDWHQMVGEFCMKVVGLPIPKVPTRLDPTRKDWAVGALTEELTEFKYAETLEDEVDALIDMSYFALGRLVEMGILSRAAFEEVQRANMQKKRGELSKRPGSRGYDAVKPEGWQSPDYSEILGVGRAELEALRREAAIGKPVCASVEVFGLGRLLEQATFQVSGDVPTAYRFDVSRHMRGVPNSVSASYEAPENLPPGSMRGRVVLPDFSRLPKEQTESSGALKFNDTKEHRPELIPAPFLKELSRLYAIGARKYAAENWRKGRPYQDYLGAHDRHLLDWRVGIDVDDETQVNHLVCATWNLITLYMQTVLGTGVDDCPDRPKQPSTLVLENGRFQIITPVEVHTHNGPQGSPKHVVGAIDCGCFSCKVRAQLNQPKETHVGR